MKSFIQFLQEEAGKNTHMVHIEDRVLYGGVNGAREAINALRSLRDMLAGSASSSTDVTVKWDGAPAIFAGIDPSDGEFFVAKKGIFNKDPKVYKSIADVEADTSGELAAKLSVAYTEMKKLGIQGVLQGDLMFTSDDIKTEKIDGQKFYMFHPNTIAYAVPVDSDLGKKIKAAKMGIVFHTSYTGASFPEMKASFDIDVSYLNDIPSVWYQDAKYKDVSGTATLTAKDTAQVTKALSNAGKIFQKIASTTLKQIEANPELAQKLEQFNNTLVRRGERIGNTTSHVKDLIKWFHDKFQKEIDKRSSEKGKKVQVGKRDELLKFFSPANKKNLASIYDLQNAIVDAKLLIINKLDKVKELSTFVLTKNGFKVTGSEGFVAIDHSTNGAVKLVDRLSFSFNNFSPTIVKGWDH